MEQRLSNSLKMTINERQFIEQALLSDLRVDGRRPFDYRRLTIKFGREDGSSEVQLGQTHVMGYVTAQLIQPYRDRPNEGTLSVFIEFSPMADPSFEAGRPGEFAVELGRIIDRGLRESRAVDTESLCVHAGKLVWSIRIDLHILDNGGNLVDAANVAAVAALLTFRRPECTIGGEDGQEVTVYPPEIKEPLPLIIHHLPIAVTFAFFSNGNIVVIDPTHNEEAVMGGRMTVTMNANADVCAVQKAGGEGIMQSVIMQCLRVASVKAADVTVKIKNAVEAYNAERALRKIKRHSSLSAVDVDGLDTKMRDLGDQYASKKEVGELSQDDVKRLENEPDKSSRNQNNALESETSSSQQGDINGRSDKKFMGGPARWDPYSKGISPDIISSCIASTELQMARAGDKEARSLEKPIESQSKQPETNLGPVPMDTSDLGQENTSKKTLKDAVKPKNRRNKKMIPIGCGAGHEETSIN